MVVLEPLVFAEGQEARLLRPSDRAAARRSFLWLAAKVCRILVAYISESTCDQGGDYPFRTSVDCDPAVRRYGGSRGNQPGAQLRPFSGAAREPQDRGHGQSDRRSTVRRRAEGFLARVAGLRSDFAADSAGGGCAAHAR